MPEAPSLVRIRPLDELDIGAIVRIEERVTGIYRPEVFEERVARYLRRDPEASQVAEADGRVVGFMLGDVRAGEFGIEEPSAWIERFGLDPDHRGQELGKRMFEAVVRHFRARGIRTVRTLVDRNDERLAGFLGALGFAPSSLQALEMRMPGATEDDR